MAERACIRKVKYDTQERADEVAIKVHTDRGVRLRSYECWVCRGWHLTGDVEPEKPGFRPRCKGARELAFERQSAERRRRFGYRGRRGRL